MISILVVSYNTRELLAGCLRSIEAHCPGAEVVVVDNASRDGSAEMVADRFPAVRLVAERTNLGFAGANNAGLPHCRGESIVLFNSDAELVDDSLQRCADWLRDHPGLGAVSPRLIGFDDRPQRCRYRFPTLGQRLRVTLRLADAPDPDEQDDSGWLAGTALMIRREALEALGGRLDDGFFMYWEDADLSIRLRRGGWGLAVHPDARIRHHGGASGGGADASRRTDLYAWYAWGRHRWFAKHRPRWQSACLWLLDGIEVPRKAIRAAIRPRRRYEWPQARVLTRILLLRLVGATPPRPAPEPIARTTRHPGPPIMNPRPVGYVGVDVLNNATVCNEVIGLLGEGVRLDLVSVYGIDRPTFYRDETIRDWAAGLSSLYPLRPRQVVADLLRAPFVFGRRFWGTLWRAATCPVEGPKQAVRIGLHLVPAIRLALHWKGRDVAHIHAQWAHTATTIAMHAANLLGVGFSFTGHANDLFVHRIGLTGKVRRARFVACISEYHRRFYLDRGAEASRLPVVYCGIDARRFRPGPEGDRRDAAPRIVAVGRLVEKKGFVDLIAACGRLRDRGLAFDCVIAGDGPEEARLRALVDRLGLGGRVQLTGRGVFQEDLPGLLRSARVFALPCVRDREGDMDGLPQVLMEAMACGVPVVSTRLVGIPDLVRDGRNGLLVRPGDVEALAKALESLLTDPEAEAAMGRMAATWARENFDRASAIRRLAGLFDWAASTPDSSPPPESLRFPPAPGSGPEYEHEAAPTRRRIPATAPTASGSMT